MDVIGEREIYLEEVFVKTVDHCAETIFLLANQVR
jgi:hypothetical protein